ncbi:MAG: type 3 dihydrofolate reductase [Gammaproteobacteria bacterium]|nr:type 3 dihydrofolate reductase [Gammaproteobacteria bacterium]
MAAIAENRVIGVRNTLPWHLPADLKYFRRLTVGHPIILGRRNYESIGRPLPERTNIVITRRTDYSAPGCRVVHTLEAALAAANGTSEIFIVGGAEVYAQTLAQADRLYLTFVHAVVPGDTFFPEFDLREWRELAREYHAADEKHAHAFSFVTLERLRPK